MVAITIMHLTERHMGHHPGQLGLTSKTAEGKVCCLSHACRKNVSGSWEGRENS